MKMNTSKQNKKIAINYIRKYLRQLLKALKTGEVDIIEFERDNYLDEIKNENIYREYSPTSRRTLKIIYNDKRVVNIN